MFLIIWFNQQVPILDISQIDHLVNLKTSQFWHVTFFTN